MPCAQHEAPPKAESRPRVFIKSVCIGHSSLSQTCSPTENSVKSWERGCVAYGLLCRRSSANLPVPLCGTHTLTKRSVLWHGRLSPKMALFLTNSEHQTSKWTLLVGSFPMPHARPPPLHLPITNTPNDAKNVILTDVNRRNTLSTQPDWKEGGERGYYCVQKFVGI